MRLKKFTLVAILGFALNSFAQTQNPLIHFPSLNPNATNIAFSYQGDIWTANIDGSNARRITIHEGYDSKPLWSKDGKTIAFQSNRNGNNDIFIMSSIGGLPKQLTFHSASDNLTDFTNKGDVIFTTRRLFAQAEWESEIHSVNQSGGTPYRILSSLGSDATVSPNGKFIAFTKGACRISREAYDGPASRDIWLYNIAKDTYTQLTTHARNDFYPKWGNDNTIYFQSSRSGRYNVHQLRIDDLGNKTGNIEAMTTFSDMGIFSFNVNGGKIIAVKDFKVYLINTADKTSIEINIPIGSDYRFDPIEKKTYTNKVDEIIVSPNGKYSALVIRGEIFVTENDKEKSKTVNLTNSSFREQNVAWLNDTTILFTSDRGLYDIFAIKSSDSKQSNLFKSLKREIVKITSTQAVESSITLSPDKKQIAYTRGRGQLIVADISSDLKLSNEKVLIDGWDTPGGIAWSPDSKWLAYSLSDLTFNEEVYIHKADNSQKSINISMHPKQDAMPVWSPDGSKLGFVSDRNNGDSDIWFVWLKKADWEKTQQEWKEGSDDEEDKDEKKSKKDGENKDKKKDKVKEVVIDFDEIYLRQVQVTAYSGSEVAPMISKDGKTFYYVTGGDWKKNGKYESDLYKIKWDGKDNKSITTGSSRPSHLSMDKKMDYIYLTTKGGKPARIKLSSDKKENLPISAKMKINFKEEASLIFEEAWKAINDGFYDPNFHGQDWGALKKIYEPLARSASTREDFKSMFNWMLGQVNASHMGLRGGEDRKKVQKTTTGKLGIEIKPVNEGVQVTSIIDNMPAARQISTLEVGDIIMQVNGYTASNSNNYYQLMNGTSGERTLLTIKSKNGSIKELEIRPQTASRSARYKAWVKEKKRLTEKYSKGKLGYIHIEGMNWGSFEEFEREITAAGLGKEGIVIDVRNNGGGWTTDYLMAVLTVRQHAYTVPRGAAKDLEKEHRNFKEFYPFSERLPLASWTKPSIAMCNETSYSNAEIFSHAYKQLGIGTLVGQPTFGAVISTGGKRLIDGSMVRMPFRGWYVKNTESNMELGPAVPDILVKNTPDEKSKGTDSQLKRAVEELLEQIGG